MNYHQGLVSKSVVPSLLRSFKIVQTKQDTFGKIISSVLRSSTDNSRVSHISGLSGDHLYVTLVPISNDKLVDLYCGGLSSILPSIQRCRVVIALFALQRIIYRGLRVCWKIMDDQGKHAASLCVYMGIQCQIISVLFFLIENLRFWQKTLLRVAVLETVQLIVLFPHVCNEIKPTDIYTMYKKQIIITRFLT